MRNYIHLGPVHIKVSGKHLAPWGYPRIRIGGLALWSWWNGGEFAPASYHPRRSLTWIWQTMLTRAKGQRGYTHNNGGLKVIWLPFGWRLHWLWQRPMWRDQLSAPAGADHG